jgi:hypothetical protein
MDVAWRGSSSSRVLAPWLPPQSPHAQPPAGESQAPPEAPAARTDEGAKLEIGAFVDGYFAWNENRPADHASFFSGSGTSAKRADEASINLAQLDLVLQPKPVGFKLSLGFGTGAEVVHGGRSAPRPAPTWQNVIQARRSGRPA